MQVLLLEGSAFERGFAYGSACSESIVERCEAWKQPIERFDGWSSSRLQQVTGNILLYMIDHAPELIEEMRGVAAAVGREFSQVFYMNCSHAIGMVGTEPANDDHASCSNWAVDTSDAGPMLGKTEDMEFYEDITVDKAFVIKKVKPSTGLRHILASRPGVTWVSTGINENGLAIGQSSGPWGPGQTGHGVSYLHIIKHLLQFCSTAWEAAELLKKTATAGKGYIFLIADAAGDSYCVEKWGNRTGIRRPENGGIFCSNLFVHPEMQFLPPRYDLENAVVRFDNLGRLYSEQARNGAYTEDFMKKVLTYHAPTASICRHGADSPADFKACSFGFLYYCREKVMMLSEDVPCKGNFLEFTFDF